MSPNCETQYDTLFVQYQNWQAPKKVKIKQRSAGQAIIHVVHDFFSLPFGIATIGELLLHNVIQK